MLMFTEGFWNFCAKFIIQKEDKECTCSACRDARIAALPVASSTPKGIKENGDGGRTRARKSASLVMLGVAAPSRLPVP